MTVTGLAFILSSLFFVWVDARIHSRCFFPESEVRSFFYDVDGDVQAGAVIAESIVDPPDAQILLASVRPEIPLEVNITQRFAIERWPSGHFALVYVDPLTLSGVKLMKLFVTVVCNGEAFPLFTVMLIRSKVTNGPQFYNEPYHMEVYEDLNVGEIVPTPVVVIDWTANSTEPNLYIEDADSPFDVIAEKSSPGSAPMWKVSANQKLSRWPTMVHLKLIKPIKRFPVILKLIAQSSTSSDRISSTTIHIHKKKPTTRRYPKALASKIQKPWASPVTLRGLIKHKPPPVSEDLLKSETTIPQFDEEVGRVPFPKSRHSTNEPPARFERCAIRIAMPENSAVGTHVTTLSVLDRKEWTMIDMVDPDGTFEIHQDSGDVYIRDNRLMDREMFNNLELVAEIRGSSHRTKCARTRVTVQLLDENDNRPAFEIDKYVFLISDKFPVGSVVGVVRARDIDEGEAGRVSYRFVNDSSLFSIRTKGRDAEIVTYSTLDGAKDLTLIVEACDDAPPFWCSKIPVYIMIPSSGFQFTKNNTTKARMNGAVLAFRQPLDFSTMTAASIVSEAITEPFTTMSNTSTAINPPKTWIRSISSETETSTDDSIFSDLPTGSRTGLVQPAVTDGESLANDVNEEPPTSSEEYERHNSTSELEENEEVTPVSTSSFAFVQPSYHFEVYGTPREGDIMGRVEAHPRVQMYAIQRKMSRMFKIDPDLGEISIGRDLNRIKDGNISFDVSATDGVHTAQAIVSVRLDPRKDSTDASPRFDRNRYVFRIPENRPATVVGVVRAYHVAVSSSDVSIQYEMIPNTGPQVPFRLHPVSGEISSETALDHESNQNYEFKVRACLSVNPNSCGYSSVVVIVVDVNDNAPQFSSPQFNISLPSDLIVNSEVITLHATDADSGANGAVDYFINPPNAVFAIDQHSGVVRTISALTKSYYDVVVDAFDRGAPKLQGSTRLVISVHGTNPSAPVFDQNSYEFILNSPVRAGSVVAELHARDPDPGPEGQISYRLDPSSDAHNYSRKFSINEQTGVISAVERITSEEGPFDFIVIAEDQSTVFKRKASTSLHIEVVGDSSLRFLPLPSTIYISTEKAVGSVVLRASAYTSSSLPVHFRVLENDKQFVMDGDLLRVAAHLFPGETHLTVRAETENTHSDHRLRIIVMFNRDKYPVFPQLIYDIDIPIESRFPLIVHRFDARVLNGTVRYRFFPDGAAPRALHLDSNTGELSVTSEYGTIPSNHDTKFVVVRAINVEFPDFYSDVGVAISLVSNRSIRFPHSIYRMKVAENIPVGTTLSPSIEVFPKSPSVNYSISPLIPLSILPNGTLFINSPIDLEQLPVDSASNLYFLVTARLGNTEAVTKVQLNIKDVNEFSPEFDLKLYEVSIPENSNAGSPIVQVKATDADKTEGSHLLYKVAGGSGRDLVFVQEDGTLILSDHILDGEMLKSFTVLVEAIDKDGNRDTTTVHVVLSDVNDNRPVFTVPSLTWNVTEGVTNETLEISASDQDTGPNSELDFHIVEGDAGHHFTIEKTSSNSALVRIVSPLDYETTSSFKLLIEATDRGDPPQSATADLTLNIMNRNDNPPIFQKVNFEQEVSVDLPDGYPLLTLAVNDADHDRLSFSLSGDEACSMLAVDPLGIVEFSTPASKRKAGIITCVVSATDGVYTANATLRLNVLAVAQPTKVLPAENHSPHFAEEIYIIVVNSSQNSQLLKKVTAVDLDGDLIRYSIEPPELRNLFDVDVEGQISVRVPLSELKQALYSFLVVAEDNGNPIMSSFTMIRLQIPENNPSSITQDLLKPTKSALRSTGGSSQNNGDSSVLTTLQHLTSTTSEKPSEMTEAVSPTASTEVRFIRPHYTYTIGSDSPIGIYLGQVELSNANDVELVFKHNKLFSIDRNFGIFTAESLGGAPAKVEDEILAVRHGMPLISVPFSVHIVPPSSSDSSSIITSSTQSSSPKEITPSSFLTTTWTSFETDTAAVTASVNDSHIQSSTAEDLFSFSRPIYFAFVPEGEYTNGIRVAVKPEALSVNRNTSVLYGIDDNAGNIPFFITAEGQLIVFDVDRESQSTYSFSIKATSNDFGVARALLNVTILDINDNHPVFDPTPSTIGVFRDIAIGTPLLTFTARDLDADNNGAVSYGLEESEIFSIDPLNGTLFVSQSLLSTSSTEFAITVFAKDGGRPSLKSTQKLVIQVFDPTVKRPQFSENQPGMVVFAGTMPGSEVGTALAGPTMNSSLSSDEKILYELLDDYNGLFKIEDDGRVILNREPRGNEKNQNFQLNITAENRYGKDSVLMNVFIEGETSSTEPRSTTQENSSTSSCYFLTKVYNAKILENREGRNRIAKVTSSCESNGQPFEYSLSTSTEDFELDPSTGEIFAVRPLDRERRTFYFLYITVTTGMRNVRQNPIVEKAKEKLTEFQTLVVVRVLDENDNAPVFIHLTPDQSVTAIVVWQARLFSSILKLEAKDIDEHPHMSYSLSGGDANYFIVNATSGVVMLARSIADYAGNLLTFTATVTDGVHRTDVPVTVHVISPSTSLVQLTAEIPHSLLDQNVVVRMLNELTGMDNHLVSKQPYVDSEGHVDATRSHLFVYALDRKSKTPYSKEDLKKILEQQQSSLLSSPSKISDVSLLSSSASAYTASDYILTIFCIILFLLLAAACCFLGPYCKRKQRTISTSDQEYMVSWATGPRPYDVEAFSRTTAQRVLAARPLPEPLTNQIEVAVSPIFVDKMFIGDKSATSMDFANSIRERPSLLQSALARQKVHATTTVPVESQQ